MSYDPSEEEEEWEDRDLPLEADMDDAEEEDSADTLPCPHCGRLIFDQSEICPHCGQHLSTGSLASGKPLWIIVAALAALAGLLAYAFL